MERYCTAGEVTDDNITRGTRTERWVHKATNTLSEYVQLTAFPRQQWQRERAWILRYMCIVFLCGPITDFDTQRTHTL